MRLSKVYDPADYSTFDDTVASLVEQHFANASPQHVSRKWEYGMALAARRVWLQWDYEQHGHANRAHGHLIKDVGGAGSPLHMMIADDAGQTVGVIDPEAEGSFALDQFLRWRGQLAHEVYCISVIEHVDDLDQFLYHLSCLVAPGGLLFLTTDFCDGYFKDGVVPDVYHWHWMRKRIFNVFSMNQTAGAFYKRDFEMLGGLEADWQWHGPIENWGYAPASLALVKRL